MTKVNNGVVYLDFEHITYHLEKMSLDLLQSVMS